MTKKQVWDWVKAALIRAVKTICQTALALIGTNQFITEVNWKGIASAAALAGVVSIFTSVAGLPEVKMKALLEEETKPPEDDA